MAKYRNKRSGEIIEIKEDEVSSLIGEFCARALISLGVIEKIPENQGGNNREDQQEQTEPTVESLSKQYDIKLNEKMGLALKLQTLDIEMSNIEKQIAELNNEESKKFPVPDTNQQN